MIEYRELIQEEFEARRERNPSYSLRAFSRDLEVSSARLSEILNSKQGLSRERALLIAQKLNYSTDQQAWFGDLVEAQDGRSPLLRQRAELRILNRERLEQSKNVRIEHQALSQWYCYAIRRLTQVKDFVSEPAWIAERLGIEQDETELVIKSMFNAGLLAFDDQGNYSIQDNIITGKVRPKKLSQAELDKMMNGFYRQVFGLIKKARKTQPVAYRDNSIHYFALRHDQVEKIKRLIRKLEDDIDAVTYETGDDADGIYCFTSHLFCVDKSWEGMEDSRQKSDSGQDV